MDVGGSLPVGIPFVLPVWIVEPQDGTAGVMTPPGSVFRPVSSAPLATWVAARRGRVGTTGGFAVEADAARRPDQPTKRRRHRWFPGMSSRRLHR